MATDSTRTPDADADDLDLDQLKQKMKEVLVDDIDISFLFTDCNNGEPIDVNDPRLLKARDDIAARQVELENINELVRASLDAIDSKTLRDKEKLAQLNADEARLEARLEAIAREIAEQQAEAQTPSPSPENE